MFDRLLSGQSLGFHCFIANLKAGREWTDLILSGMTSHILGAKNDNDSVFLYTDFAGLCRKTFAYSWYDKWNMSLKEKHL